MARIWYSVCGEGMGHAIRSDIIITELLKKHDLLITAAEKAYPYLKKKYGRRVHRIEGNTYVYEKNQIRLRKSLLRFAKNLPYQTYVAFKKVFPLVKKFNPDLIISDFESMSHYFSKIMRKPCISIDNIHTLTECNVKTPLLIHAGLKLLHPTSNHYILSAFSDAKPRNRRTIIVPPIIRKEVINLKPLSKDFILVYQTSPTNNKMLPILKKAESRFKIYGMGKTRKDENLKFMEFDDRRFLDDLRSCKYVIVNGGFTVISEALYLKKPILTIPIGRQIEQIYNGISLRKMGFGDYTKRLSIKDLNSFESRLPIFKKNLKKMEKWDNSKLFSTLDKLIESNTFL